MPRFYGKNIAQNAQRRFLAKWAAEHPESGKNGLERAAEEAGKERAADLGRRK
uniref:Uncharacterized protein n=1 Tax=Caudovirales sp. ctu3532 TaxID=2827639 RepID=A0A8S5TI37_9CAUD|nr:MAG TPA: hypothetical protein [Caudovirales sp. ctu3532]